MSTNDETSRLVKFILLGISVVPSLLCDLIIFTYLIRRWRREILAAPQNHVILCLLVVSFVQKTIDVPSLLHYYRSADVLIHDDTFCSVWIWIDYSFVIGNSHLLTWCCIERHLFVFNSQMMKERKYLILLHYIPLTISVIYLPSFYASMIFFPTGCSNTWDYSAIVCGAPCYIYLPVFGTVDWLFNCATPTLMIVLVNCLLFCRIIWQKVKQQRPVLWRRQRRMIIQLALISILFLVFLSPSVVVGAIQALWRSDFLADIQYNLFFFLTYFPNQFLPLVILSQLPALRHDVYSWFRNTVRLYPQPTRIHPRSGTNGFAMSRFIH